MSFISYTIFSDVACTQVRNVANLYGDKAVEVLRSFKNLKGFEPKEGDIICGCRIDRIGSEDWADAWE